MKQCVRDLQLTMEDQNYSYKLGFGIDVTDTKLQEFQTHTTFVGRGTMNVWKSKKRGDLVNVTLCKHFQESGMLGDRNVFLLKKALYYYDHHT